MELEISLEAIMVWLIEAVFCCCDSHPRMRLFGGCGFNCSPSLGSSLDAVYLRWSILVHLHTVCVTGWHGSKSQSRSGQLYLQK
uniref:Secreted protein n=1 Tax=Aegilops tauschii subsp. strangulata TaxID=200361 RepID=A0A453A6Y7_AEGTS